MEKRNTKLLILLAFFTYLAFSIRLDIPEFDDVAFIPKMILMNLTGSFAGFSMPYAVLLPGIFLIFLYISGRTDRKDMLSVSVVIPSVLFSLFMVWGYSYSVSDSSELLFGIANGQLIKTILVCCGYFIFFTFVISYCYYLLDQNSSPCPGAAADGHGGWYFRALRAHTFRTLFITLVIIFIPYAVVSWPAKFMGDTPIQIKQGFEQVDQLHTVVHTLFIHVCILAGKKLFDSYNAGVFIYSLIQTLVFLYAVSRAASVLYRKNVISAKHIILLELYLFFNPLIHGYLFLVTKDVLYSACLLIFLISLYCMISEGSSRIGIGMILSGLGIMVFRNEGWVVLALAFILTAVIDPDFRKPAVFIAAGVIGINFLVFQTLYNVFGFPPGSRGEMFSIPFQQTARCILTDNEGITPHEKEVIDKILPLDRIADYYVADIPGRVKNLYQAGTSDRELADYFKVWAEMLIKHPDIYLQAFWNSKYKFFYPGEERYGLYSYEWSDAMMAQINERIAYLDVSFSHPEGMDKIRNLSDIVTENGRSIPGINFLTTSAFHIWALIILFFFGVKTGNKKIITLLAVPLMLILAMMIGPENGNYGRYIYPLAVLLPFLPGIVFSVNSSRN